MLLSCMITQTLLSLLLVWMMEAAHVSVQVVLGMKVGGRQQCRGLCAPGLNRMMAALLRTGPHGKRVGWLHLYSGGLHRISCQAVPPVDVQWDVEIGVEAHFDVKSSLFHAWRGRTRCRTQHRTLGWVQTLPETTLFLESTHSHLQPKLIEHSENNKHALIM